MKVLKTLLIILFTTIVDGSVNGNVNGRVSNSVGNTARTNASFKLGIENISAKFVQQFKGKQIGLITNQTGVDQRGKSTIDILRDKGLSVAYLFAPEHGVDGKSGGGERVAHGMDKKRNIPIVSLYGHGSGQMIPANIIAKIDVIMFDIQDSGMRHYTYISTLNHALRVAQKYGKDFVVFDRPNPLGIVMEGPLVEDRLRSFISVAPIPLRHGMTVGELARYFNKYELKEPARLQVIPMDQYNRFSSIASTFSVPLSPGLRTMESCYGYSFLGLLGEITPFGIGLHTDARYQCIALPKRLGIARKEWVSLQGELKKHGIDTLLYEYVNPKTNACFNGLRLAIKDINKVHAFAGLYAVLRFFHKRGVSLSFSRDFDLAVGTAGMRKVLNGNGSYMVLADQVNTQLVQFLEKARVSFLYAPFPTPQFIK